MSQTPNELLVHSLPHPPETLHFVSTCRRFRCPGAEETGGPSSCAPSLVEISRAARELYHRHANIRELICDVNRSECCVNSFTSLKYTDEKNMLALRIYQLERQTVLSITVYLVLVSLVVCDGLKPPGLCSTYIHIHVHVVNTCLFMFPGRHNL